MICHKNYPFIISKSVILENKFIPVYFGSTNNLKSRHNNHLSYYKLWKKGDLKCKYTYTYTYFNLYEKYGIENCQLVILEEFIGLSKFQLAEKEAYYVKNYHCFNKNIPNQWLNNPNYYPNYYRNWCSINKQFIYEKLNCVCGSHYTRSNKIKHLKTNKHLKYVNLNSLINDI